LSCSASFYLLSSVHPSVSISLIEASSPRTPSASSASSASSAPLPSLSSFSSSQPPPVCLFSCATTPFGTSPLVSSSYCTHTHSLIGLLDTRIATASVSVLLLLLLLLADLPLEQLVPCRVLCCTVPRILFYPVLHRCFCFSFCFSLLHCLALPCLAQGSLAQLCPALLYHNITYHTFALPFPALACLA
jgi:hypothetical protein